MRILVLGAGAIGGDFGGRLVESGADSLFPSAWSCCAELERDGLRIESALGQHLASRPYGDGGFVAPDYDVALLACKPMTCSHPSKSIGRAVGRQTAVITSAQRSAHFAALDARFGASRAMGGTCMIYATLGSDGVVDHGGTLQRLASASAPPTAVRSPRPQPSRPFRPARPSTGHSPMTSSRYCGTKLCSWLRWPRSPVCSAPTCAKS